MNLREFQLFSSNFSEGEEDTSPFYRHLNRTDIIQKGIFLLFKVKKLAVFHEQKTRKHQIYVKKSILYANF